MAPRIKSYIFFGMGRDEPFTTPEKARQWVDQIAARGADGVKFFGYRAGHHAGGDRGGEEEGAALRLPPRADGRGAGQRPRPRRAGGSPRWSTGTACPRRCSTAAPIQDYPLDYNYADESHRFGEAGRLWKQAAAPFSKKWNEVMDELIKLDFTIDPTFNIYEASRDLMRARRAEWHDEYTLPSLWDFYVRAARRTAPTGTTGRPRTRSTGRTTTGSGWPSSTSTRTVAAG